MRFLIFLIACLRDIFGIGVVALQKIILQYFAIISVYSSSLVARQFLVFTLIFFGLPLLQALKINA